MARPIQLSNGTTAPSCEEAFELAKQYTARLIPLKTVCEAIGMDHARFVGWLENNKGKLLELGMIRGQAMIELQEKVVAGGKGWQSAARLLESFDPETWLKKNPNAFGRKPNDASPYAAAMLKK